MVSEAKRIMKTSIVVERGTVAFGKWPIEVGYLHLGGPNGFELSKCYPDVWKFAIVGA